MEEAGVVVVVETRPPWEVVGVVSCENPSAMAAEARERGRLVAMAEEAAVDPPLAVVVEAAACDYCCFP